MEEGGPELKSVSCPTLGMDGSHTHTLAYVEWHCTGPAGASAPVIVMVHGLSRNSRDFDKVALAVREKYRVISVDMPGRLRSEWFEDPANYGYPQYVADIQHLVAHLKLSTIDYLGTSMGGLIGMTLAATKDKKFAINKMILNDVGPVVPRQALLRIAEYVGKDPKFKNKEEMIAYSIASYSTFCAREEDWEYLFPYSYRLLTEEEKGGDPSLVYGMHYDPKIGNPFKDTDKLLTVEFWPVWEGMDCGSLLLLRGGNSGLLLSETVEQMKKTGRAKENPHWMSVTEFPGVGHAPMLMSPEQIASITDFLCGK